MQRYLLYICVAALLPQAATAARYPEAEWQARFAHRPFPEYPARYRRLRLTGSGLFRLHVTEQGRVTGVTILKSTGHKELDSVAVSALLRWRGRPGPKWELDIPITFSMDMNHRPRNPASVKTFRGR